MADLNETLGTLPSGARNRLSDDDLTRFLRETYDTQKEHDRRKAMRKRLDLYKDRGLKHFETELRGVFKNDRVFQWRKALIPFALFQNFTKRVFNEKSTVYAQPATRTVAAKRANDVYREFQRSVAIDQSMKLVNRYVNLLNEVLVYPWTQDDGTPRLDVVTPDRFCAISHPNDPLRFVGAVIDRVPRGLGVLPTSPHYMVCDEETWFQLDEDWRMVPNSRKPHGLGRIPVLLAHRQLPDEELLDSTSGQDVISAHSTLALLNTMMLKHQKSGTRVPYATGDTSNVTREQPMDEESLLELGEGIALGTLDLGADPENYIKAGRAVIKQAAANHGIPESVFDLSYQATSGFEIELKRVNLKELREEQILDYRGLERRLAELQSGIMDGTRYAFPTDGWQIRFGDVAQPQEPMAQLAYWEKAIRNGLTNLEEVYLQQNPEATHQQARLAVAENLQLYLERVRLFQEISAPMRSDDERKQEDRQEQDEEQPRGRGKQ